MTDKGEWLMYRAHVKGQSAQQLLAGMVSTALAKLPIPKLMRWGDSDVQFVRPVHTVTMLLGADLIPGTVLGIDSARTVRGHRFMGEAEFTLDNADQYPQILLERGKVVADYEARKALIKRDAELAAQKIGGKADLSDSLLEEVASLVEWPVVLTAKFEEKFLAVPAEALVYTMKGDQKYFPVYDAAGKLLPNFIFVANIESKDPQQIISGNEKVVRPRLADAEFFFNTDRKKRLEDNLPRLETVLFQQQLGTLRDKTDRIQALAGWVAGQIGADVNHATRAGLLSKCDLMTNMVFEFTDTQGVMGMHYARHDGEAEDVAVALNEQYQPRYAGDALPQSLVACSLAIADKMDTLAGIFGIGQHPKGDKDPFALRRAALGVLRIIVEKNLPLDLQTLTEEAVRLYGSKLTNAKVVDEVVEFMLVLPRLVSGRRPRRRYHSGGAGAPSDQTGRLRRARQGGIPLPHAGRGGGIGCGQQTRLQHSGQVYRNAERQRARLGAEGCGGDPAGDSPGGAARQVAAVLRGGQLPGSAGGTGCAA